MIATSYHIVLILSGVKWHWHVEDDELTAVKRGECGDYHEATKEALAAFDYLRKKEQEAQP